MKKKENKSHPIQRRVRNQVALDSEELGDTAYSISALSMRELAEKNYVVTAQNRAQTIDATLARCLGDVFTQIDLAIDELFANIARYAYGPDGGQATVRVEKQEIPPMAVITFIDRGIPFDPLKKKDPDTTLSAVERQVGGLGIYLVKKSMDGMAYEYKDGQNILTVKSLSLKPGR